MTREKLLEQLCIRISSETLGELDAYVRAREQEARVPLSRSLGAREILDDWAEEGRRQASSRRLLTATRRGNHDRRVPESLRVEVAGEGVEPETVDARAMLELAAAYFEMLAKVAHEPLTFRGLAIENKCIALASWPSSLEIARSAALDAEAYLTQQIEPDPSLRDSLRRVRAARRALPSGQTAKVIIGPWERRIEVPEDAREQWPRAVTSLRAMVMRVGGLKPRVMFQSGSEDSAFSLEVSIDQAHALGGLLYREVDIVASIARSPEDRRIRGGILDEFVVVDDGDARAAWTKWLADSAPQWSEVRDIEALLLVDDEEDAA